MRVFSLNSLRIIVLILSGGFMQASFALSWNKTKMPGIGEVKAFASVGNSLFAGTKNGRIFRTEDDGNTWSKVWEFPSGRDPAPVHSFLQGDSILLAASGYKADLGLWDCWGTSCTSPAAYGDLMRSRDGGLTWKSSGLKAVTALAQVRNSRSINAKISVLASTLKGIFLTEDWGLTWKEIPLQPSPERADSLLRSTAVIDMVVLESDRSVLESEVYVLTRQGLYRLMGYGKYPGQLFWGFQPAPSTYSIKRVLEYATCLSQNGNEILACTPSGVLAAKSQRFSQYMSWDTVSRTVLSKIINSGNEMLGLYTKVNWAKSHDDKAYRSLDSGRSWTPFISDTNWDRSVIRHHELYFRSSPSQAVHRYNSKSNLWMQTALGIYDEPVSQVVLSGGAVLASVGSTHFMQRDPGLTDTWNDLTPFKTNQGWTSLAAQGNDVFAVNEGLQLSRSHGSPGSWTILASNQEGRLVVGNGWQAVFHHNNSRTLCASGTCEDLPAGDLPTPSNNNTNSIYINDFSAATTDGDTLYLILDSLYRSNDRGRTFSHAQPLPHYLRGNLIKHSNRLYLSGNLPWLPDTSRYFSSPSLVTSSDGGKSWSNALVEGIRGARQIRLLASRPGELFVAGDSGVFVRKDGEEKWTDLSAGLPSRFIEAISVEGSLLAVSPKSGPVMLMDLEPAMVAIAIPKTKEFSKPASIVRGKVWTPTRGWHQANGRILRSSKH